MAREGIAGLRLLRVRDPDGRVRVGVVTGDELSVLATDDMLGTLQAGELPSATESVPILDTETCALPEPWTLLTPVVAPETWAAGVTYERSRDARLHESKVADVYDLVYDACRPELFLKDAAGHRTVGPGDPISTRADASWTVPEPELAVVLGRGGAPLAVTIGNDVSSRDIEGAIPAPRQPAACRHRAADRHGHRAARRDRAQAGTIGRDSHPRHRHAAQSGRRGNTVQRASGGQRTCPMSAG